MENYDDILPSIDKVMDDILSEFENRDDENDYTLKAWAKPAVPKGAVELEKEEERGIGGDEKVVKPVEEEEKEPQSGDSQRSCSVEDREEVEEEVINFNMNIGKPPVKASEKNPLNMNKKIPANTEGTAPRQSQTNSEAVSRSIAAPSEIAPKEYFFTSNKSIFDFLKW